MAWSWLKAKPLVLAGMAFVLISGIAGGTILVNGSGNPPPRTAASRTQPQGSAAQTDAHAPALPSPSQQTCASATATGCDRRNLPPAGSNGSPGCKGKGKATITASPIALSDLLYIQPMGLEIGGHVTPIDHGYFYIKGAAAKPPTIAPVYAPFAGNISVVSRTIRNASPGTNAGAQVPKTYDDDAITIEATCTFRVRYSNLVNFGGELLQAIGQLQPNENKPLTYAVKAGELIGYTGLPTAYGIDVWVENDDSTLTGFIKPAQYAAAESWKLHMVDLYDNTQEPLKGQLLAFAMRDADPRFGKIDYDIDGKLIGSWFKVGSGGYGANMHGAEGYWLGHLSIVPDGNDPTQIVISLGDYQGQAQQFATFAKQPDPASVDQSTGLVKYELGQIQVYSATTGQAWGGQQYLPHIRARASGPVAGTILVQLTGMRELKMETFPNKTAAQVRGFDGGALAYER
jgi:hypothetical protein